jgi:hypothetical protein
MFSTWRCLTIGALEDVLGPTRCGEPSLIRFHLCLALGDVYTIGALEAVLRPTGCEELSLVRFHICLALNN